MARTEQLLARAVLAALVVLTVAGAAPAEEFHYALPAGYTDLSTDAQREKAIGLPHEAVERAKKFRTYALWFEDGQPIGEITVIVESARGSVADSIESIARQAEKFSPEGFRLVNKGPITQAGVSCGTVEYVSTVHAVDVHKLVYILPLGTERALVALETRPEHLAKVRPGFDASVSAVRGLRSTEDSSKNTAIIGAIMSAALVGVGIRQALRGRKRRPARSK